MGRTQRRRLKKVPIKHLDCLTELVNLRKWMSQREWKNDTHLKLAVFPESGRGVMSTNNLRKNYPIITIPLNLLITYNTIQASLTEIIYPPSQPLEIHDLLTLFLVMEKNKERSLWGEYINSLPQEPPALPWLGTAEEINLYPPDLRIISRKKRKNLEESMYRLKRSIAKHPDCVLDEYLFKWGYVLVNTRAVYIRPDVVRTMNKYPLDDVLSDEPKMALCPFLDMFNHHFLAESEMDLVNRQGKWLYELKTLCNVKKFDEIFISYGSHDNVKLLMEYGFYLPGNNLDAIHFDLKEVLNVLGVTLNEKQYKFIKSHHFDEELSVGYSGISFNLKAVLFVCFNEEIRNYSSVVFNEYPNDFLKDMAKWVEELLNHKVSVYNEDYNKFRMCDFVKSRHGVLMEDFLGYRKSIPEILKERLIQ